MSFLYDDFFADPETTVEIHPKLWQNGEQVVVPMQVRRRLSLADRERINTESVTYTVNTLTQEVTPQIDQVKSTIMALKTLIVSWPFTNKDGSPVPITEETLRRLGSSNADIIMLEIAGIDRQKAADRDPFDAASGEASTKPLAS